MIDAFHSARKGLMTFIENIQLIYTSWLFLEWHLAPYGKLKIDYTSGDICSVYSFALFAQYIFCKVCVTWVSM